MKSKITLGVISLLTVGPTFGQGLFYSGSDSQESQPIKWVVGASVIYDDNVSPGYGPKTSSFGVNPSVAASFISNSPQTSWNVYARLGVIYYFDAPSTMDSISPQSRVGLNFTHRFSERLRFSSTNFVSYELEPDYSYGYASSRITGPYFFWSTDNAVGFRWTERFATYTGLRLSGTNYADVPNNDRISWDAYNQFRYQLSPQTVATSDLRYGETYGNGLASDASDFFILAGLEHRFSAATIGIVSAGAQFHSISGGDSYTSPYLQFALNSQVNQELNVRSYMRYGIEGNGNVQSISTIGPLVEFNNQQVFRLGVAAEYAISKKFSLFSGIDYIPTSYAGGVTVPGGLPVGDLTTDIFNVYIGMSMKVTDAITGSVSYNYSKSSSDFENATYERNRINVGVSTQF